MIVMKSFVLKITGNVKAFVKSMKYRLSKKLEKGYSVFTFDERSVLPLVNTLFNKNRYLKVSNHSVIKISSILTEGTPLNLPIYIATLKAIVGDRTILEIKFYAFKNNLSETEYFLSVIAYNMVSGSIDVFSSRSIAMLKSSAINFEFKLDWDNKKILVFKPVKMQSMNKAKMQYSIDLPNYDNLNPPTFFLDKPTLYKRPYKRFQLIRSITVD